VFCPVNFRISQAPPQREKRALERREVMRAIMCERYFALRRQGVRQ